eukprot:811323-Pleurochrysis_carterae.AAC.2
MSVRAVMYSYFASDFASSTGGMNAQGHAATLVYTLRRHAHARAHRSRAATLMKKAAFDGDPDLNCHRRISTSTPNSHPNCFFNFRPQFYSPA